MDFNSKISRYFLENNRLTVLSLLILLLLGTGSTSLLKTTGFPNPDLKFVVVQSFYFGASSETVAHELTAPIELALRDIEGVDSFSSSSSSSFSLVSVSLEEDADTDTTIGRIDSALSSIDLPDGVENPMVFAPSITGPDFIFSLISKNREELFQTYQQIEEEVRALPATVEITPMVELERRVLITLHEDEMAEFGVTVDQIEFTLSTLGESFPVVSDVSLDGESTSIRTTLQGDALNALYTLSFNGHSLNSFASIQIDYEYAGQTPRTAFNIDGDGFVFESLLFTVKGKEDADKADYETQLLDIFSELEGVELVQDHDFNSGFSDTLLVENYSVNTENERQVEEVVAGFIGGDLPIDGPLAHVGWLLGGIQLVFLVMVAFVSFRAAVISALAIPLSMVFVSIYLFFIGENLNTLVLFSLVLAIGLVVDPALVLLESIQRKIDGGLKGKEAALEGVKDVGMGLFLACLTSIIVFVPFGVVSGVLGQIISYIPLTIIPAVVGSYVVPLVFLAWFGAYFLKRGKKGTEEENLWWIAKLLIRFNEWILSGSRILRIFLILIAIALPFGVAGYYFSTGEVKSVQFSSSDNYDQLQLAYTFYPSTPPEEREDLYKQMLKIIANNDYVESIFPLGDGATTFVQLKSAEERGEVRSIEISEAINVKLDQELGDEFYDLRTGVISNGPPAGAYQVTLALKSEDLEVLNEYAKDVGETLLNVCEKENVYSIDEDCENPVVTKVDDGFTGKESTVIEVLLDRDLLAEKQLLIPNAPLTLYVNLTLKKLFDVSTNDSVGQVSVDGEPVDIVLEKLEEDPTTLEDIKNAEIFTFAGEVLRLRDIAIVRSVEAPASISRLNGETISVVQARLADEYNDQATASIVTQTVLDYYEEPEWLEQYSEGDSAGFIRSFQELFVALLLSIILTYVVLVVFFSSFTQPVVILFAVPLTFIGVFPALAYLGNGQFGFLEIIGLIILVGIVENVAIFLIDAANQKIKEGWDEVKAISYASGVRLRAVILTKMTTMVSLAPLAVLSEQYRSLSLVIMFGLLTSGVTSLFTTPILFIFFHWLSRKFHALTMVHKILFFPLFPLYLLGFAFTD